MIYICENPECPNCGKEFRYLRNTYKMVDGVLISNNAECPSCGKIRKEINPDEVPLSEKNIELLRYDMSTPEQKREMLKKRAHDHYKEKIEPLKQDKINTAVQNFKEASRT